MKSNVGQKENMKSFFFIYCFEIELKKKKNGFNMPNLKIPSVLIFFILVRNTNKRFN